MTWPGLANFINTFVIFFLADEIIVKNVEQTRKVLTLQNCQIDMVIKVKKLQKFVEIFLVLL